MTESTLKRQIVSLLQARGFWAKRMPVGPHQVSGLPDILAIRFGLAWWFEAKLPGEEPTRIQRHRLEELEEAGSRCFVVSSVDDVEDAINVIGA